MPRIGEGRRIEDKMKKVDLTITSIAVTFF